MNLDTFLRDARYALRMLAKNPGFAAVAILTLAIGIGGISAIFTVVNGVLLRPLPYGEPDNLVRVWERNLIGGDRLTLSPADFLDWKAQNQAFEDMSAYRNTSFIWEGDGEPEAIAATQATTNLFTVLRVTPILGRSFAPDDATTFAVVLLSHGLWQRRFGSDPRILGKTLSFQGSPLTVIGVLPPGFQFPLASGRAIDLYTPLPPAVLQQGRNAKVILSVARLKSGVSVDVAFRDLDAIARRLAEQYPNTNKDRRVTVGLLLESLVAESKNIVWLFFGTAALVLLIALANVANLLLARAVGRQKEIAVRAALGSGGIRIVRQLLTESMLLSMIGGIAGVGVAYLGTRFIVANIPQGFPRIDQIRLDPYVLSFTLFVTLIAGVAFGIAPALEAAKPDLNRVLKEGSSSATESSWRPSVRKGLVVSEIAFAILLLIGASLTGKSFWRLLSQPLGIERENIVTFPINLPSARYQNETARNLFFDTLRKRVGALPGVELAASGQTSPLPSMIQRQSITIDGRNTAPAPMVMTLFVGRDYFRLSGIPFKAGRTFNENEAAVVINERMARELWPGENPIGQRLYGGGTAIVGVVGNHRNAGLDQEMGAQMFIQCGPCNQLLVKTRSDPALMIPAIRAEITALDPKLPVANIQTVDQIFSAAVAAPRFRMTVFGVFASVAVILAVLGIYGVTSYAVAQRTHEVGIRMALGASRSDIMFMMLRQSIFTLLAGIALGLTGALGLTHLLRSYLFQVTPTDPLVFVGVPSVLALVALVAHLIPARRSTRIDPMVCLRHE